MSSGTFKVWITYHLTRARPIPYDRAMLTTRQVAKLAGIARQNVLIRASKRKIVPKRFGSQFLWTKEQARRLAR